MARVEPGTPGWGPLLNEDLDYLEATALDAKRSVDGVVAEVADAVSTVTTAATAAQAAADRAEQISGLETVEDAFDLSLPGKMQDPADPVGATLKNAIGDQVGPLVADAIADDDTVVLAAAAAVEDAMLEADWYRETLHSVGAVSTRVVIDPLDGGGQALTLSGPTTIVPAVTGADPGSTLVLVIGQTGGPHAVTWSPRVTWSGGIAPVLAAATGEVDVVTLLRVGAGWLGFPSGLALPQPSSAIVDTFTRADSASLGFTETGEAWTSTGWSVASGKAVPTTAAGTTLALVNAGVASGVRVSCKPSQHVQHLRLTARCSAGNTTYYRLVWDSLSGGTTYLQKNVGAGQVKVGADFSLGFAAGATGTVSLQVTESGGTVTLRVFRQAVGAPSATEVYSTTDATPPPVATYAGMQAPVAPLYPVDDFRVDFL